MNVVTDLMRSLAEATQATVIVVAVDHLAEADTRHVVDEATNDPNEHDAKPYARLVASRIEYFRNRGAVCSMPGTWHRLFGLLCTLILAGVCHAEAAGADMDERELCMDFEPLKKPFFGDLHVHTRYSLDASTQGTLTTPDQVYRFAKGEGLGIQPWIDGMPSRHLKLARPLDFAMVSDHAELMGETQLCSDAESAHFGAWQCLLYRQWPRGAFYWFNFWSAQYRERVGFCDGTDDCRLAAVGPWHDIRRAAEAHYDRSARCAFTTFVGYEWTGGASGEKHGNIHRNVVFRNARVPDLPISYFDAGSATALFKGLDAECRDAGECESLVIPHNTNLSAGIMFEAPLDVPEARLRARYEVLAEIMQHKGSSECYFDPLTSTDEYCGFEQLPTRSFSDNTPPQPNDGFLREVLKEGLERSRGLKINPFQFGFIGSSDTHLGAAGQVAEDTFVGHGGAGIPAAEEIPIGLPDLLEYNPGGLAVLWAEENSRRALFTAMQRREAYATSGPRMTVRLFAGENLAHDLCADDGFAERGYALGVPMGGSLDGRAGNPIRIAMQALKDAKSNDLERLQVVKGWIDAAGERHEKVIDIDVVGEPQKIDSATCEVAGRGAAELCAVWQDSEFDPTQPAFYYGRVLEGPSCRWSQRMCVANGVDCSNPESVSEGFEGCCASAHRPVIYERAWTSPVWYVPKIPGSEIQPPP